MSEFFIFDPNQPDLFVERWMEEVGNLHKGEKYNGWAFFDDDRRLLDVYITDIDAKWVDVDFDVEAAENGPWDGVIDRAQRVGATNLLQVHAHLATEPEGPCPDLADIVSAGKTLLLEHGINLRATVVLHGDELDGLLIAHARSETQIVPGVPSPATILEEIKRRAAMGDPFAQQMAPMLEEILKQYDGAGPIDTNLLSRAMDLAIKQVADEELPTPINPLQLPRLDVRKDLLN